MVTDAPHFQASLHPKELQAAIQELQQELQRRAEAACCQKRRDKERREKMEKENEILRQKSTLGWMLGCLYG